jgi:hypothetical protein
MPKPAQNHGKVASITPDEQLDREWTRIKGIIPLGVPHAEEHWPNMTGEEHPTTNEHLPKLIQSEIRLTYLRNQMDTL